MRESVSLYGSQCMTILNDTSGLCILCTHMLVSLMLCVCTRFAHKSQSRQNATEIQPEPLKCWKSFQPENPILINILNWIFPSASLYCFCSNISIRHTWTEIDGAQSSKELHSSTYARTQRLQRAMVASFHAN